MLAFMVSLGCVRDCVGVYFLLLVAQRDASPLHMADPIALAYVLGVTRADGKKPCENDQRVQLHDWEKKYVTETFLEPESFAARVTHAISLGQEPETIMAAVGFSALYSALTPVFLM
jgi:hypothetical protein